MNNTEVEKKKRKTLYGILFIFLLTILATLIALFLCPQMRKICIQDEIIILFYILIFVIITIILKMIKIEKIMKIYGWLSILAIFIWEVVLILFLCPQMRKICIQDEIIILLTYILILLTSELLLFALIPFNKELGVAKYIDFSNKGYLLYEQGEYRGASHCFRKALEYVDSFYEFILALNRYDIHCALGNTLGNLGVEAEKKSGEGKGRKFFEEALEKYNEIVRKKQESDTEKEKKEDMAIEEYETAGKKQREYYWQARYGRAHIFNDLEQFDNAVKEFREVKNRIDKFREYKKQGKALEDNLENKINFAETYCSFGNVLGKLADKKEIKSDKNGLYEEAKEAFEQAINIDDDYWEAHQGLADILHKLNDLKGAEEHYEKVIKLTPGHAEACLGLGNVLGQLGIRDSNEDEARKSFIKSAGHYKKAINLRPNYAEAYSGLGDVLAELAKSESDKSVQIGRYKEAINNYKKAIEYMPDLSKAHYGMGNVRMKSGEIEEGENNLQKAKTHYEKAKDAYEITIAYKPECEDAKRNLEMAKQKIAEIDEKLSNKK